MAKEAQWIQDQEKGCRDHLGSNGATSKEAGTLGDRTKPKEVGRSVAIQSHTK